jgi:hypothetical protein
MATRPMKATKWSSGVKSIFVNTEQSTTLLVHIGETRVISLAVRGTFR